MLALDENLEDHKLQTDPQGTMQNMSYSQCLGSKRGSSIPSVGAVYPCMLLSSGAVPAELKTL